MSDPQNEYERARQSRIEDNKRKLEALGLQAAAQELRRAMEPTPKPRAPPRKRRQYEIEVEVRRCSRLAGQEPQSLAEDKLFEKIGIDKLDVIFAPRRRQRIGVDPARLNELRERRVREVDGEGARGPIDSGLGVRIQGGRVYDSKYGVTCHWCRQKTLEDHVTCMSEDCGGGRKLPISFCKLCLKNRHGEDIAQAEASGKWVCPRCRGSCGEGCKLCCNCGPCRKAAGLAPTHQIIGQARAAGFENVHDYLVHQATGEGAEAIAARKRTHAWAAWLDVPFDPEATESEGEEQEAAAAAAPAASAREEESELTVSAVTDGLLELDSLDTAAPRGSDEPSLPSGGSSSGVNKAAAPKPKAAVAATAAPAAEASPSPRRTARHAKPAAGIAAAEPAAAPRPRLSTRHAAQAAEQQQQQGKVTAFFKVTQKEQLPANTTKAGTKTRKGAAAARAEPAITRGGRLGLRSRKPVVQAVA